MRIGITMTLALAAATASVLPTQDCPFNVSNMAMTGLAGGLSFRGSSALMTNAADGFQDQLKAVDVSNASKLEVAWSKSYSSLCPSKTILSPVTIGGPHAFIPFRCSELGGPDPTGLLIIDISNPLAPVEKPRYEITDNDSNGFTALALIGSYGYAASGAAGLRVLNFSDPMAPTPVAMLDTDGYAAAIAARTNYAFILDVPYGTERGEGLVAVDISKPGQPRKVSSFTGALNPVQFLYADGFAYISDQGEISSNKGAGIWVLDLTRPTSPRVASFYPTSLPPWGLALKGNNLYVGLTSSSGGILILNVTDKGKPFDKGFAYGIFPSGAVQAYGNYIYMGVVGRLRVYDPAGCEVEHHVRPLAKP